MLKFAMHALILLLISSLSAQQAPKRIQKVKVRILSTMLADDGIGEWGFAAVVEADNRRILFDTGARPDTVLKNAHELKVDLAGITDVILSHNHSDHTGGLLTLRRELTKTNAQALSRAHVGEGIFTPRVNPAGGQVNPMPAIKAEYETGGGRFVIHQKAGEIFPHAWLTGPVPRVYPERNWSGSLRLKPAGGSESEDNVPEDQSLVLDTEQGLVLISGCGHAGIINTIEHARKQIRAAPLVAAIGGFHLFQAGDEHLEWTAGKLKEFGIRSFLGAHCTGIEAVYRLRSLAGLDRRTCAVGAVGGGFDSEKGLEPGMIAK
jgi:7,8-dihydropterin-6-yl-methyl-4-(beta-D-ribofuranosyl)aminobenzene 5'-phosphate synthase